MKKYDSDQIILFLNSIDSYLSKPFELVIIGGTAAALAYKVRMHTQDIDSIYSIKGLEHAYEKARQETGLNIILDQVGVWDGPFDFESRLITIQIKGLKWLCIKAPEIHDLVLMKILRGSEHDLQAINEMHTNNPLSLEVLVKRMNHEMTHVVGDKGQILVSFFAMVERLFGEKELKKTERELRSWKKS